MAKSAFGLCRFQPLSPLVDVMHLSANKMRTENVATIILTGLAEFFPLSAKL